MPAVAINLRDKATAERLFTYPNDGHENETLEDTIHHYFSDSLSREGLSNFIIAPGGDAAGYFVQITVDDAQVAEQVRLHYQTFFDVGLIGFQDADAFKASGHWAATWKFLLPLGVPIAFAHAVEIMDFPPLTLINNQDYLNSKTTSRWWELLIVNGVSEADKARYSCICDIAPVAAKASDGSVLDKSGIYNGPFDTYSLALLELLAASQVVGAQRPLIALGMPIRTWILRLWNLAINVGDVGTIKLRNGASCAVMASNHPSFFYYAVHSNTGPGADAKNLATGLAVLKQDIVAAAWQAKMGGNPQLDPHTTLVQCQQEWANRDDELIEIVKRQGGITAPRTLAFSPADIVDFLPSSTDLRLLERRFYLEGRKDLPEEFW
jgi:hypothetical protein